MHTERRGFAHWPALPAAHTVVMNFIHVGVDAKHGLDAAAQHVTRAREASST
jgi:hypothetical protein